MANLKEKKKKLMFFAPTIIFSCFMGPKTKQLQKSCSRSLLSSSIMVDANRLLTRLPNSNPRSLGAGGCS